MDYKEQNKALLASASVQLTDGELALSMLQGMIAAEISVRRHELGLSQKAFAEMMGVSQGLVSRWENGDTNFTLGTLVDIAGKLGLELQCPFVQRYPLAYGQGNNVVAFPSPGPNIYRSYSIGTDTRYETSADQDRDPKEM